MTYKLMEEKVLLSASWVLALIGLTTLNYVAVIFSIIASFSVIVRNRNAVIELVTKYLDLFKNWLDKKRKEDE